MWYVMQVYTGMEAEVCQQCQSVVMKQDEEVFVPLAERMTKTKGEWSLTMSRLFPGYVFVDTERIEDFHERLKYIGGMTKILRTGEEMTPVYPQEEAYLRLLGGREHIVRYSQGYIRGEELIIISGPMKNWKGQVKKVLRHRRLVALEVPLMGHLVEVTVGMGIVSRQGDEKVARMAQS